MISALRDILVKIRAMDDAYGNNIVSSVLMDEGFDDLEDLKKVMHKVEQDVMSLKSLELNNMYMITDKLIDIHIQLQNIVWHVDQVHEIVVDAIKKGCEITDTLSQK